MRLPSVVTSQLDRWTDRLVCVCGAVAAAQGPEFMQQYLQRLGGHLDEARRQLAVFQGIAERAGLTLAQLVEQTRNTGVSTSAPRADSVAATAQRVDDLTQAHQALKQASTWERPWIFIRDLDTGIVAATWQDYRPAVPTTGEGLVYAAVGLAVAVALYYGLVRWPVVRLWQRRQRR